MRQLAAQPAPDIAKMQAVWNAGVAAGGPFYWLGAAMTRAIVQRLGPTALAEPLENGGVEFFHTYVRASAAQPDALPISAATIAAIQPMRP
jgi:hypothetical protein